MVYHCISVITIWLFNIAMENHHAINRQTIYKWAIYTMAMLLITRWYFFVFKRSYWFDKDTLWQSMASWEIIYLFGNFTVCFWKSLKIISLNWQIIQLAMVMLSRKRADCGMTRGFFARQTTNEKPGIQRINMVIYCEYNPNITKHQYGYKLHKL